VGLGLLDAPAPVQAPESPSPQQENNFRTWLNSLQQAKIPSAAAGEVSASAQKRSAPETGAHKQENGMNDVAWPAIPADRVYGIPFSSIRQGVDPLENR
jgi:hypothetical protein